LSIEAVARSSARALASRSSARALASRSSARALASRMSLGVGGRPNFL
jgi:hypothetical protein